MVDDHKSTENGPKTVPKLTPNGPYTSLAHGLRMARSPKSTSMDPRTRSCDNKDGRPKRGAGGAGRRGEVNRRPFKELYCHKNEFEGPLMCFLTNVPCANHAQEKCTDRLGSVLGQIWCRFWLIDGHQSIEHGPKIDPKLTQNGPYTSLAHGSSRSPYLAKTRYTH